MVYMNRIGKCSQADERAIIGDCKISRMRFADAFVVHFTTESALQCDLNTVVLQLHMAVVTLPE